MEDGGAGQVAITHKLELEHAFGVYPVAMRDAVTALGDDAFLFCVGRQLAVYDYVTHRLSFLNREAKNRLVTAVARSANGQLLAVAERVCGETKDGEGAAQISILSLPRSDSLDASKSETIKLLHPQNRRLDLIGVAFATDGKILVSMSAMPDCTLTYWRWEREKAVAVHDCKPSLPLTRLQINPQLSKEGRVQLSISGPKYMKVWEYNPNDSRLSELPSMMPGLHQEKQLDFVDHCWMANGVLCAATEDGHVHLFEDCEHRCDVDVRSVIAEAESSGAKAREKEQAQVLQSWLGGAGGAAPAVNQVKLSTIAAWSRGFVVGGDQGYLGVFKVGAGIQIEPFGTFRMPGEDATIYHMSAGSEDTHLTILSYQERESEDDSNSVMKPTRTAKSRGGNMLEEELVKMDKMWSLSTFPVGQADLASTGQLEIFSPVIPMGAHHGPIHSMGNGGSRSIVATCGADMHLKVWGYPCDREGQHTFESEQSIQVSTYEKPRFVAVHPLGYQAAVVLNDSVRIYHLTTQHVTRTLYELPLKRPGHCTYSNSGDMLVVTTEHDVVLLDPWRAAVIHNFGGKGGHLSQATQVLFSDDDRMLLSSARAPHGAIYGWDLESETKERTFEHICKHTTYASMAYDFRKQLVIACTRPEGNIKVIGHLSNPLLDIPAEGRGAGYTVLSLDVARGLLYAGTEQGSVRLFRWPFVGDAPPSPFTELSIHAHSITCLATSQDSRLLFSACEGGAMVACRIQAVGGEQPSGQDLLQKYVQFRRRTDEDKQSDSKRKTGRDDEKKFAELQRKLTDAAQGLTASCARLDELCLVPKAFLNERLSDIKELEEKMQRLRQESEYTLEHKEQEIAEKLNSMKNEKKRERGNADEKYDGLFTQLKKSNERHTESMTSANSQFDRRTQELQKDLEARLSKEYEKQSELLNELQKTKDRHAGESDATSEVHDAQLKELRGMQENAMREWKDVYDKVCNVLKSDGLKFEEALSQQESEYESQIAEILEHKRVALQVESEKSTTALKDGVSMRQTISILHRQIQAKDVDLIKAKTELEDTRKKLEDSLDMFRKQEAKLKERERGLQVKDESLAKLREQMKHLESFRFVLFHKVKELEEERDPLEQQVNSLKTSVRDMYGEFVREFRQKQKLDQQLGDRKTLVESMQKENTELQNHLAQLKKDARRLIQEMENALHAESVKEFEKMPMKLATVLEKHKKLNCWAPPSTEQEGSLQAGQDDENEQSLLQELQAQKNLLFRKNQIAVGQASSTKRECMQDFRRLTHENAELIAEMNRLRNEKKSLERSFKEMEAQLISFRAAKRESGGAAPGGVGALARNASAPSLGGSPVGALAAATGPGRPVAGRPGPVGDTPFIRRKVADQQEMQRKQRQRGVNQLPPVSDRGPVGSAGMRVTAPKPSMEEMRFVQTMGLVDAGRGHLENQGFDMGRLAAAAEAMSGFHEGAAIPQDGAAGAAAVSAGAGTGVST